MPEVFSKMGKPSIITAQAQLPDRALELIGSKTNGVLQSEFRKLLGIESSKCSKIVFKLERSGLIKRHSVSTGGYRTFLLTLTAPKARDAPITHHIDTYLTEIYLLYLMRGSMN
jgi:DNA-binding MarR family transcriptional regulator